MQDARVIEVGEMMGGETWGMAIFEFGVAAIINGCFVDDAAALLACRAVVGDGARRMSYCGQEREGRDQGLNTTLRCRRDAKGKVIWFVDYLYLI